MLNDAVTKCHIFVPLVTEKYGKTEWTNREVGHISHFICQSEWPWLSVEWVSPLT